MPKACIVIPTFNEGRIILEVIEEIREGFKTTRYTEIVILVIDDSSDDTRDLATAAGAKVIRGEGEGLGAAMYKGLKSTLKYEPDVIMLVDGDGQADPANEIPRFLEPIDRGEADLVLGSRFLEKGLVHYNYPLVNRFGIIVLSRILRIQTGLPLTDSHGGIRAMVPSVVAELEMLGTHTYVQETIIDAAEKNYRIVEIPSTWRKREAGKSRVVRSITKYVFYTLPILVLRSGQHIRYLYSLGILCVLGGLAVFGGVMVQEGFKIALLHRMPALVLIALLVSTGLQLFFFGFILQLLKQMKKNVDRQLQLGLRQQSPGDDDR
jgi:glycosyltransferase involved in cell wall biosynthesis